MFISTTTSQAPLTELSQEQRATTKSNDKGKLTHMTRGSRIHDELGEHFRICSRCRDANPEKTRLQQPLSLRHNIPATTLAALCPAGCHIYQAYLRWLTET